MNNITNFLAENWRVIDISILIITAAFFLLWWWYDLKLMVANDTIKAANYTNGKLDVQYRESKDRWAAEVRKQTDLFQECQSKLKDRDATIVILREEREKLSNASLSTIHDLQEQLAISEDANKWLGNRYHKLLTKWNAKLREEIVIEPPIKTYTKREIKGKKFSIRCRTQSEFGRIVRLMGYDFTDATTFNQYVNVPYANCKDRSIETWAHKGFTIIDSTQVIR